jgi:hypothetical protein
MNAYLDGTIVQQYHVQNNMFYKSKEKVSMSNVS